MKKVLLLISLGAVLSASACQQSETASNTTGGGGNSSSTAATNPADTKTAPGPSSGAGLKFPVADFPAVATTAKAGEFVLAPEYPVIADASLKGLDVVFGEYYQNTMDAPGAEMSAVKFYRDSKVNQVPNQFLITIPAGQTAKKGDIVLGYMMPWGMQRAIVTDDADPKSPTVAMLDRDYTDPPKYPTDKIEAKLEPNTFIKLGSELAPGASIYVTGSNTLDSVYRVISTSGEKVLARTGSGYFKVFNKSECKLIPFAISVKPGDKVRAEWGSALAPATVTKVDARIGRVWITSDNGGSNQQPKPLGYGHLLKN